MLDYVKKKIKQSKLYSEPFPFFVVYDLIPKELDKINKILPSFNKIKEKDIYFQSSSQTKKTLLPSSNRYKTLNKNKNFKKINTIFKKFKTSNNFKSLKNR